ncbi:MAG: hypothetical protein J3K34DRAFT_520008 [Monoraphidium minutum]|nr:MAG: hypothetical protein J3K34DRAFT_520008 [Monoraphidium minutum]
MRPRCGAARCRARSLAALALALALAACAAARGSSAAAQPGQAQQQEEALHPCEPYCSLGAVKPFYGDISSSGGLKAALAARSFRREVILMISEARRLDANLGAWYSLRALGLGHVLFVSTDAATCRAVEMLEPELGCTWQERGDMPPHWGPLLVLFQAKERVALRAARLGYNVLSVDMDTVFFHSPYPFLKSPLFENVHLAVQGESGPDYASLHGLNTGIMYVRGEAMHPGGPAAWLLAETIYRPLRWEDDGWAAAAAQGLVRTCLHIDQDALNDAALGAVSGALLSRFASAHCLRGPSGEELDGDAAAAARATADAIDDVAGWKRKWRLDTSPVPPAWAAVIGADETQLKWVELRVPNARGWPDELGGRWMRTPAGNFSAALLRQLAADCPACPLWPDPYDSTAAAAADAAPRERLALLPAWLGFGFMGRGMQGLWEPRMLGGAPAQQVIGHFWFTPGLEYGKRALALALGRFDFDAAERTRALLAGGPRAAYLACGHTVPWYALPPGQGGGGGGLVDGGATGPSEEQGGGGGGCGAAEEGRLACAGSWGARVDLTPLTPAQLAAALRGLAQVAALMGRTAVWPDAPCGAAVWARPEGGAPPRGGAPFVVAREALPWGEFRCAWWPSTHLTCVDGGRGMLVWEFERWKAVRRRAAAAAAREAGAGPAAEAEALEPTEGVNVIRLVEANGTGDGAPGARPAASQAAGAREGEHARQHGHWRHQRHEQRRLQQQQQQHQQQQGWPPQRAAAGAAAAAGQDYVVVDPDDGGRELRPAPPLLEIEAWRLRGQLLALAAGGGSRGGGGAARGALLSQRVLYLDALVHVPMVESAGAAPTRPRRDRGEWLLRRKERERAARERAGLAGWLGGLFAAGSGGEEGEEGEDAEAGAAGGSGGNGTAANATAPHRAATNGSSAGGGAGGGGWLAGAAAALRGAQQQANATVSRLAGGLRQGLPWGGAAGGADDASLPPPFEEGPGDPQPPPPAAAAAARRLQEAIGAAAAAAAQGQQQGRARDAGAPRPRKGLGLNKWQRKHGVRARPAPAALAAPSAAAAAAAPGALPKPLLPPPGWQPQACVGPEGLPPLAEGVQQYLAVEAACPALAVPAAAWHDALGAHRRRRGAVEGAAAPPAGELR